MRLPNSVQVLVGYNVKGVFLGPPFKGTLPETRVFVGPSPLSPLTLETHAGGLPRCAVFGFSGEDLRRTS